MTVGHAADPPQVLVNMLWCVPGKVGGSEEYLVRQLLGLAEVGAPYRVAVAGAQGLAAAHPELAAAGIGVREPTFASHNRVRRIVGESTWLRRHAAVAELVHHGGGTAPPLARQPYVLTIHDLQFRTYPEYFSRLKRAYLGALIPRSVRRAAVVAVPSDYVRESLIDAYRADPERVLVVPHGVEPALAADVTPADELRLMYRLGDGPVIVYPAVTHPHKQHQFLLQMMAAHWTDPDLRLVLIGGEGSAEAAVAACTDKRVLRLGRVPAAHRNGLLALAAALVFPSQYEGFGAPLIEAMTLGAPVVCSDATCMPGIVADAGLVRPLAAEAWADVLDEVCLRREQLVVAGRERARQFTARASGAALAAVYARALQHT